jgi:hypothetical protein
MNRLIALTALPLLLTACGRNTSLVGEWRPIETTQGGSPHRFSEQESSAGRWVFTYNGVYTAGTGTHRVVCGYTVTNDLITIDDGGWGKYHWRFTIEGQRLIVSDEDYGSTTVLSRFHSE